MLIQCQNYTCTSYLMLYMYIWHLLLNYNAMLYGTVYVILQ